MLGGICSTHFARVESNPMIASSPGHDLARLREIWIVTALTLIGGVIRVWAPGRLGLIHFDEGIYALAGLWVFSPNGFSGLDPGTIAYAPPGFPFLVGLFYMCFGVGDVASILVSITMGTLTIPIVGWLAYRTFGRGAGVAAATFVALSGQHIAFSRLALTDVSFLLFWLLAISQGQRFLERPTFLNASLLGLFVGLAQLFKYNGWITGILVALTAAIWLLSRLGKRSLESQIATWGWGLFAVLVAAGVYWPWFRFVESNGGYAALLAHHRSYLGSFNVWPRDLQVQLAQEDLLSGGRWWLSACGLTAACLSLFGLGDDQIKTRSIPGILMKTFSLTALSMLPHVGWWVAASWVAFSMVTRLRHVSLALCLLLVGWSMLFFLTPFYHPYARLVLPLQAFNWLFMGGAFTLIRSHAKFRDSVIRHDFVESFISLPVFTVFSIGLCLAVALVVPDTRTQSRLEDLLQPSDDVRRACVLISRDLPKDITTLRLYVRPPVTFYLSGTVPLFPQPSLDRLLSSSDSGGWALVDMAMARQDGITEARFSEMIHQWVLVRDVSTTLNLPTLLDIDPGFATRGAGDRSASLLLLRPKRPGEVK